MNDDTLLLRQIHLSWIRAGEVTSQAFRPSKKDAGQLSVYDGDRIKPRVAWEHYTGVLMYLSAGVVAVSVSECNTEELPVTDNPLPRFPEHALIDFRGLSRKSIEQKARALKEAANARGWLFRPDSEFTAP